MQRAPMAFTSSDRIWDFTRFGGSKENNVILSGVASHNFAPFLDKNPAAKPTERYKALAGFEQQLVCLRLSRWHSLAETPSRTCHDQGDVRLAESCVLGSRRHLVTALTRDILIVAIIKAFDRFKTADRWTFCIGPILVLITMRRTCRRHISTRMPPFPVQGGPTTSGVSDAICSGAKENQ